MRRILLRFDAVGFRLACRRLLAVACLLAAGAARLSAAEAEPAASPEPTAAPAIDSRFASESPDTPDFRRHIVPLLGRLGCNGRACH
ncbi:MAG: hypothetical protein ACKOTB_08055, partial [Planctomycetia bacterium]